MKRVVQLMSPRDSELIDIRSRIHVLRGVQVMLDRDLADLYGVSTKALNQAVKRNLDRFPDGFMFRLSTEENEVLKLQSVTSSVARAPYVTLRSQFVTSKRGGVRYLPCAFSEHGIVMLASVLRSETAVQVSIRIVNAFVAMRHAVASLAPLLERIETAERRQISDQTRNEDRFMLILDAMQDKAFPPQKVFYDGEVFDADVFATKHILSAKKSILLIDGWVDIVTLEMLGKKKVGVDVEIVSSPRGNKLAASDVEKFNAQYGGLTVRTSTRFHDRFLIVDDRELYLIGASLKDLGKKCFAFAKLDSSEIPALKARL